MWDLFHEALLKAPDDRSAFLDAACGDEPELRAEVWGPYVFVNADREAASLASQLGALSDALERTGWSTLRYRTTRTWDIACNWKVYAENYLEGYHIPMLHPALNREIALKDYVVEVGEGFAVHRASPRPRVKEPVYEGFWAWLAPNVALNVYAHGMSIERMTPTGPESMRLDYLFFFRDGAEDEREAALAMTRQVTGRVALGFSRMQDPVLSPRAMDLTQMPLARG